MYSKNPPPPYVSDLTGNCSTFTKCFEDCLRLYNAINPLNVNIGFVYMSSAHGGAMCPCFEPPTFFFSAQALTFLSLE